MQGLALMVQQGLKRDPHGGDLFVVCDRAGSLVKIISHDGVGMSRTSLQRACLLDGIDWRSPQYS